MKSKEELEEYSLKINTVAKYQKEANDYKKKAIFSGIVAGLGTILSVNEVILLSNSNSKNELIIHFLGILGYSLLTALGFYYNAIMKEKKEDCDNFVLALKENIKHL